MTFDPDLYKIKALTIPPDFQSDVCMEKEKVVCGFLYQINGVEVVKVDERDAIDINPNTVCRNTGVKVKGVYLYEKDLVKHGSSINQGEIGIVVWDDFKKEWCIQSNANFSGRSPLRQKNIIEIIGNYALSKDDADMFQKYSDDEDVKYSGIGREPECRSAAHINKLAKQFLPR
jgi:hypothetical protein